MEQQEFFKGLKVIELSSVLAGPAVGMFFAELGAEVIKIENKLTNGDVTRKWKLPQEDIDQPESAYFHAVNWNKRHLFFNLKKETDHCRLMEYLSDADVVITNYKKGSAEKLKVDYSSISKLNPAIIYASVTAYGEDDSRPGFDVVIQAETGWMSMNGERDGNAVKMPVALMDILTAHQLKEGILIALLKRYKTGKGSKVTVSLFDTGVASLANQAANWLNLKHLPKRMGSQHPNIAPYGDVFKTKDNQELIVAPGTEVQFQLLCEVLKIPSLKNDEKFKTNPLRLANRPELVQLLTTAVRKFELKDILTICHQKGIPVAPIRNLKEVFELKESQHLILEEKMKDQSISKRVRTTVFQISG